MQYKYVPKEYEVEVKSYQHELVDTGCTNVFGTPVPCRAKRSADEAEAAAPAVLPYYAHYPYHTPYAYSHPLHYAVSIFAHQNSVRARPRQTHTLIILSLIHI